MKTREELCLIYCIGEANRLAEEGKITFGQIFLDLEAIEIYQHLTETDFDSTLTFEERQGLTQWLQITDPRQPLNTSPAVTATEPSPGPPNQD